MYRGQEKVEDEVDLKPKGFDLTVTHRHPKTGLVTHTDPYILRVIASGDGKVRVWERPAGSGNLWDKHNKPCGRWDKSKPEGERYLKDAEHIAWTAPETSDAKVARESAEKDVKIAELEKELAAIRAEREAKAPVAQAKKNQGA